jgi:hypothetical protein
VFSPAGHSLSSFFWFESDSSSSKINATRDARRHFKRISMGSALSALPAAFLPITGMNFKELFYYPFDARSD